MSPSTSKTTGSVVTTERTVLPRPSGRPRGSPADSLHPDVVARILRGLLAATRQYFVQSARVAKGRPPTTSRAASLRAADPRLLELRERIVAAADQLGPALQARPHLRCGVLALAWCIDRLEGRPRAPWSGWMRRKHHFQSHLLWCRRFRLASARADETLRRSHRGLQGALRALNLRRGSIGPVPVEHAGESFGETSLPDVDLAPAPPPMALLAGRALAHVPEEFVLGARGLAPDTDARRTLDGFSTAWSVVSQCALDRACATDSSRRHRVAYAIAGVALACAVAEQSPASWHANGLDERLRAAAKAPGLPKELRTLAARAALHRLPAHDTAAIEVLARLAQHELPPDDAATSVRARIARLSGPIRRVADALLARYPGFLPPTEMTSIFAESGNGSKASTIADTLRRRHGVPLESATAARRADPSLPGSLGKGYRLAEDPR